jgi:hypothetical protein
MSHFKDGYKSPRLDPLAESVEPFPYEDIEAALATAPHMSEVELAKWIETRAREMTQDAFRLFLQYLTEGDYRSAKFTPQIARRLIGAAWAIDPNLFDGLSLTELSQCNGIDCHKSSLSEYAVHFRDTFGIHNRGMPSNESRAKYRRAALRRAKGSNQYKPAKE